MPGDRVLHLAGWSCLGCSGERCCGKGKGPSPAQKPLSRLGILGLYSRIFLLPKPMPAPWHPSLSFSFMPRPSACHLLPIPWLSKPGIWRSPDKEVHASFSRSPSLPLTPAGGVQRETGCLRMEASFCPPRDF